MPLLPLPIVAELAPGANPGASPGTWNFTSDGVRWRTKAGIGITLGRDDEDATTTAGSCDVTFDDRDGKLSPRNVMGEWYGELDRNTPIRLVLDTIHDQFSRVQAAGGWGTDPYSDRVWTHTAGSSWAVDGSYGTCTLTYNAAAYALPERSFGGDIDVYHVSRLDTMPVGGAWVNATAVRFSTTGNHYRLHTEFQADGTVRVKIVRMLGSVSTDLVALTTTGVTFTAGQEIATHVQAIGATLQIRVWRVGIDAEPDVWHASTQDATLLGTRVGLYQWRLNTSGPTTIKIDNFRVRTDLYGGMVPEWPVRWPNKSGADSITPVTASGILRWLEQNTPPGRAPIDLQLSGQPTAAYWRLDEGEAATAGGSALGRGSTATVVGGTFGNDDSPAGGIRSLELTNAGTSKVTGNVNAWPFANNGYQVMVFAKMGSMPAASPAVPFLEVRAIGRVTRWVVTCDAATFNLTGYDTDNVQVATTGGVFYGDMNPTQWFAFSIKVAESGASALYEMNWHQVGSTPFWGLNGSYTGTADRIVGATVIAPVDGTLVEHLWIGSRDAVLYTDQFRLTSAGYAGETDVERVARVFADIDVEVIVHPGEGVQLGPQPKSATALQVARDAEIAGFGVLYERGPILAYLPLQARQNPPVAMALDWSLGHLAEPPEPVDDDLEAVNRFTATRPSGSSRTVDDPDDIAKYREYADGGEFNVYADDQLSDVASMEVAEGTVNALRWPRIVIDLIAHPELIGQWLACRIGSRVTVANVPKQIEGELVDLIIEGYTQEITKHIWRVELTCSPAAPWSQFAVWGTAAPDAETTELAADISSSATAIPIRSLWESDTWAPEGGYVWRIHGERPVTVISVTAPVLASGYYTQTATVTRSPTLARAHKAGRPVRLSAATRWGLGD